MRTTVGKIWSEVLFNKTATLKLANLLKVKRLKCCTNGTKLRRQYHLIGLVHTSFGISG